MKIAIRHHLQVYDPADGSLREDEAFILPVRDAEAVMGETVAAYLARVGWRFDVPTVCRINGEFYGRAEWETRALAVNDNVEFVSRPLGSGGGSTGKSIMSIVALVALSAVAGPAGSALSGALGLTGFAASAVTAATSAIIIGAGSLALSYFLKPKSGGKSDSTDALYSFGLQGNKARPMQPIPVLNGRLKFAPDYAAPTYSEYSGDGMVDYALFGITCGRWRPEQVLIGDTPIWHYQNGYNPDYPGVELQFVEPGAQVTLYPVNVVTADELTGAELSTTFTPGYIVNAAGTQAKELLLDFVWPGGAYHTSKDKTIKADTHILVRVRTVDDAGAPKGGWIEVFGKVYTNKKQSQIRVTERITLLPDRYEVSVRRVNPPTAEGNGTDAVTWTALRAHIEGPQSFPRVSTLAVKGVASKELSGISGGQLRVIGTRILPVWRDGQFVEEPTRSIAWAALDWWRNGDYAAGLSIADTDFQAFVRYDALWSALGHTFDRRTTEAQTLDDVLETVLKAGRAFPSPVGDKITITRDEPRGLPRMLFTENDIVRDSLEISYALSDQAWSDGIVGEYLDETTWRLAEVSSAPDGVVLLNPARVQLEGIVNRKQATGIIRFMAAESQYRRITASWTARMEGRLLKRGDLVKLTAEEPETWGQSCECVGVAQDGVTLTLDPAPMWETGSRHYIEIRRRDARPWGPHPVTRGSNDATVIVNHEGDHEGLADALERTDTQEAPWVAFSPGEPRTFAVLITEGDPDQDGEHIHLTGAIDAAEVYSTTENGVPPLLQIPDLFSSAMPVILGLSARASQRQLTIILTAGWQPAKNAASYIADVSYDGGTEWIRAYEGDRTTFEAVVGGSDQMRVRVAGVTPNGTRGAFYVVELTVPDLVVSNSTVGLLKIEYADLNKEIRDNLERIDRIKAEADAAVKEAQDAVNGALERLNLVRRSLSSNPAIRQGYIDPIIGGLREDMETLTQSVTRNVQDLSLLRDNLVNAGLQVIPGEGRVRIYAIEELRDAVGRTINNVQINVNALKGQIELYASTQREDIEGVLEQITTVTSTLDALEGTITDAVTQAIFDPLDARLSSAETQISTQGISLTASQAVIDRQGVRLTTAEQQINAITGEISQTVRAATADLRLDLDLLPRTLAGFQDFIQQQSGRLAQSFAYATTNMAANFDEAGRATASLRTELLVYKDGASAQFLSITKAVADVNFALVTQTSALQAGINDTQAQVLSESQARATGDTALGQRIDSVSASVADNTATINSVSTASADRDSALAKRIEQVFVYSDNKLAQVFELNTASVTRDEALTESISAANSRIDSNEASILAEASTRASETSSLAENAYNLFTRTGGIESNVTKLDKSVTDIYVAQASTNIDLYARTDRGTAFGRFGMTAQSAPSGVSVRLAMQASTESQGQQRNAGLFIDLLDNGSSRVVVDANLFAITANGGTTYPFTFDGQTLTIPSLRVTQQLIVDNAVSDKVVVGGGMNFDAGTPVPISQAQIKEVPGTRIAFDVDTDLWAINWTITTALVVTATGDRNNYKSVSLEIGIGLNGNLYNNRFTNERSVGAGGGTVGNGPNTSETGGIGSSNMEFFGRGQNYISLMYRLSGNEGCTGRITFAQIKALISKR